MRHSWLTIFISDVWHTQNFYRLCSTYSYYQILAVFPVLYNISLWLIYFIHSNLYLLIICPYFIPPPFPLPTGNNWFITLNFFIIYLFWLCWVLVAVLQAPASCGQQGLLSRCWEWASHCSGFSWCGLQSIGSVAPQHVGSSWSRDRTCFPYLGRRILNHWTTGGVLAQ